VSPAEGETGAVWSALDGVKDPELPVISIVQLGMVREVRVEGARCTVVFSPTFLGCPASRLISLEIARAVRALGLEPDVQVSHAKPWSPSQISAPGREALRAVHISIGHGAVTEEGALGGLESLEKDRVPCSRCGSEDTVLVSAFGSTRCRAVRRCNPCQGLFEQLKPL
jgi:ring-1,2-phenylacetyl-CoA epoxidase subunit PaaD